MLRMIAMCLSLCVCCFAGGNAFAVTFNFLSQNAGPGNPLQVNGITITPWADDGLPTTVLGWGLGDAAHQTSGNLDRSWSYPNPGGGFGEGVTIHVNGAINSFTVDHVYMNSIEKPPATIPAIQIPFQIGCYGYNAAWSGPRWEYVDPTAMTSYTFQMPGGVPPVEDLLIMNASADDPSPGFMNILAQYGYPEITIYYGFTVSSIDYTPRYQAPELGTLLPLCTGLIGLAGFRRRLRKK